VIDLLPSDEQQQIIDSVADYFARTEPASRVPANGGESAAILMRQEMAALGWFSLGLAEADGGIGYSLIEEMLVAREFGRALASPALCAVIVAAHVAAQAGQRDMLRSILAGNLGVGVVIPVPSTDGTGGVNLIAAQGAQLLLQWNTSGAGLYERGAFAPSTIGKSLDETVGFERSAQTTMQPVAWVSSAESPLPYRAGLLIGAQLVGVAEAAKDLAVAYAKVREQFGQPIGAFQAIKHACAEMAVQCEVAYAQTFFAGLSVGGGLPDAEFQYAAAGLLAPDAALRNARMGIQIHGAIGFTSDCLAHRYLKRAHLLKWLTMPAHTLRAMCIAADPIYGPTPRAGTA
jgi:alkylation response protein AidB-like acyl-CoA dehydrogenase